MIRDLAQTGLADRIITPGPTNVILPPGSVDANITVTGVIVPAAKVLNDTTIAGTQGTMLNKTASATVITPSNADQAIPQGYYPGGAADGKVAAVVVPVANVLTGTTIAGQAGAYPTNPSGGTQSWTTPGTYSWTVPAGITRVLAGMHGGGGGGSGGSGAYGGSGGGGGAYNSAWVNVTAGSSVTVIVGAGGTAGAPSVAGGNGGSSSFGSVSANGGTGGSLYPQSAGGGGAASTSSPYVSGYNGGTSSNTYGAGGAGSGGTAGAGNPGTGGGASSFITPGVAGGGGGAAVSSSNGNPGVAPGGGGGGGWSTTNSGGAGGAGAVYIQW